MFSLAMTGGSCRLGRPAAVDEVRPGGFDHFPAIGQVSQGFDLFF